MSVLSGTGRANGWLWVLLALTVASYHTAAAFMTQTSLAGLLAALVWGGALICLEDQIPDQPPAPSAVGFSLGVVLLAFGLWRTAQMSDLDAVFYAMPVVLGLGLALMYVPFRRLGEFRDPLLALCLLMVGLVVFRKVPEEALSELTAQITKVLLLGMTIESRVQGNVVLLAGGGVKIGTVCNGIDMIAELVVISGIFLLAFKMRAWWRKLLMIILAPVLAVIGNSFRIALLAIVNASDWSSKESVFHFFHDETGALVFAGLTVGVFGWIYVRVLNPELKQKRTGSAGG